MKMIDRFFKSMMIVMAKTPHTGIENLNKIPLSLRWWNVAACGFQFGQAGALFYLATKADLFWPIYVNFPGEFDGSDQEDFGVPSPKQVASYSVVWLSGMFLALSGLDHFLVSFPGINKKYNVCTTTPLFCATVKRLILSLLTSTLSQTVP